jgi:hypothetical protein
MRLFGDQATQRALRARYPTQLHEQAWFHTHYLTLNVHLRRSTSLTRRAVNYAFDRRQFAEILGGGMPPARPARSCRPDSRAMSLTVPYVEPIRAERRASSVHSSRIGNCDMTVDVYGNSMLRATQYVASVLRDIGYRPVSTC